MSATWTGQGEAMREAIYAYIVRSLREEQLSPTYREIAAAVGIESPDHVAYHIDELVRRGRLTRKRGLSRTLRPAGAL